MKFRDLLSLLAAVFFAGLLIGNKLAGHEPIDPRRPAPGELVIASGGQIVAGQGEVRLCGPDTILSISGEGTIVTNVSMRGLDEHPIRMRE